MTDPTVVVLKIGTEGGDIALLGRVGPSGTWQFRRATEDQTDMLLGEAETSWHSGSGWVTGWDAALEQLDRYPWAMLTPLEVHSAFRARVREALEARWAHTDDKRRIALLQSRWQDLLGQR